jgi:hypothetical protein
MMIERYGTAEDVIDVESYMRHESASAIES